MIRPTASAPSSGRPAGVEPDRLRADAAMAKPAGVRGRQRVGQRQQHGQRLGRGQPASPGHQLAQPAAAGPRADNGHPVLICHDIGHRQQVRVPNRPHLLDTGAGDLEAIDRQHGHRDLVDGPQILSTPETDRCGVMARAGPLDCLVGADHKRHGRGQ